MDKSICPYCQLPLEEGEMFPINCGKVYWCPEGKSLPPISIGQNKKMVEDGFIIIRNDSLLSAIRINTKVCRNCGYLITWADDNLIEYEK